ncbi:MAG: tetratricopeptide repeat protein [Bacteriovoracaceae bacterium]|jgi:TolA-binding protein|nr:tetratricopeptide repeat protein [Bacteriovoracaceae bacterium]
MKLIYLLTLLSLTSCFKTAEDIRREKLVDTMEQRLEQSSRLVADLTTRVQSLQNNQMDASGKIEEMTHLQTTNQKELNESFQKNLLQLQEQIKVLIANDTKNQSQIKSLTKEIASLKKYIGNVTGTLTKIAGPTKATSQSKLQMAHEAFEKNKQKKATKLYKECLSENLVNNAQKNHIYFNLGLMSYWNKKYDDALVSFSKIYTKYPKSRLAHKSLLYIARSFKKKGKKDEALATFSKVTTQYPKSSSAKKAKKEMKF